MGAWRSLCSWSRDISSEHRATCFEAERYAAKYDTHAQFVSPPVDSHLVVFFCACALAFVAWRADDAQMRELRSREEQARELQARAVDATSGAHRQRLHRISGQQVVFFCFACCQAHMRHVRCSLRTMVYSIVLLLILLSCCSAGGFVASIGRHGNFSNTSRLLNVVINKQREHCSDKHCSDEHCSDEQHQQ